MAPKWTYFLTRFWRAGEPNRIQIWIRNRVGVRTISIFRVIRYLNLESLQVWIHIIRAGLHARQFRRVRLGHDSWGADVIRTRCIRVPRCTAICHHLNICQIEDRNWIKKDVALGVTKRLRSMV